MYADAQAHAQAFLKYVDSSQAFDFEGDSEYDGGSFDSDWLAMLGQAGHTRAPLAHSSLTWLMKSRLETLLSIALSAYQLCFYVSLLQCS